MDQHVRRQLIELAFPGGILVKMLSQARTAEVAKQQEPILEVAGEDFRGAQPAAD